MLEMFMRQSVGLPYYPDSGPGTKYLSQGDTELGFFGLVPESELGFFPTMLDDSGMTSDQRRYDPALDNRWLKFFWKGKVVYYPGFKTGSVTYNALQSAKMTFDALKRGTGDTPATLPTGVTMWQMNPTYTAKDGDILYVRAIDTQPNSPSSVFGVTVDTLSEFYGIYVSVFSATLPNPTGVKLPVSVVSNLYAGQVPLGTGCELVSASLASGIILSPEHASYNTNNQQGVNTLAVWFPVVQLLDPEDKAKIPFAPTDIESWSDAVNSRPTGWVMVESMIAPFNIRAPLDQSVIQPKAVVAGVRGTRITSIVGPTNQIKEYGEMSYVDPLLISGQSENVPLQNAGERGLTVGNLAIMPDNMYEGTSIACCSGWVQGAEMYTPFGMGGTQGGGEDKYPAYVSVFNWQTGVKRRIAPGSPSGFTWYSGTRHNNGRFYMAGGYIAGSQTKNVYSWPLTSPASPTAHAVFPGTTRVITNMCSLPTQNKIMLMGGYNLSNTSYNEAALYDVATNVWTSITPPGQGLYYAAMGASATHVYVIGGISSAGGVGTVNNFIRIYDIAGNSWSTVPTTFGFFKAIGQAVVYNGHVIAIGGLDQTNQANAFAIVFNISTQEIRVKALGVPPQALGVCDMQDDGFIWVGPGVNPNRAGAYDDNRPRNMVARFDPAKIIAA